MSVFIRWFREVGTADRPSVGGKGASLGELQRAGLRVPQGFVIATPAFRRFAESVDPDGAIKRRIGRLNHTEATSIEAASADVRERLETAPIPHEVRRAIVDAYGQLCREGDHPVAVRSSATSEDSATASFAGLQDTYLWMRSLDDVLESIRRCWSSLYSVPSVTYRRRLGIAEDEVAMGVVVQLMVVPRCAGVMFTRSPVTGDRSVIAIEASWCLGSCLVSGEVTPDKITFNKITGLVGKYIISTKLTRHVPDETASGVRVEAVPQELQSQPCLADGEILALCELARKAETVYCHAVDIEWAIDQRIEPPENIMLLQCRPETVWSSREQKPVAAQKSDALGHILALLGGDGKRKT
jgi:pyruvate,water dikinase